MVIERLQRHYWVVTLLVLAGGAFFAARATVHLVAGQYLVGAPLPATWTVRQAPRRAAATGHGKSTTAILERNIFCSTCPPIIQDRGEPAGDDEAGKEIPSTLPLELVATLTSSRATWEVAIIKDKGGGEQSAGRGRPRRIYPSAAYRTGERLAGYDAEVERIDERRVYLAVADHLEYLDLLKPEKAAAGRAPAPRRPAPRPGGGLSSDDLRQGVNTASATQSQIDRALLDTVLANSNTVARSARIVPSVSPKDRRPNGFKLYAIRPGSIYSVIGLQNGDTLTAINDQPLDSPQKAFEMYAKFRTASNLQLSILRRGRPMTFDYSIR